ncbi:1-deoxy-D-xylulose-5-phosphate reductoisomerase [Clostridiisalibacter paucivorans]|uniref:1-deoxy-D-xylulose-5-phosphate reductoisomerase n=1 Tax=Clostridiisalibacter paucivorans TaxID=408753 RepID=UPI000479A0B4|nr:1-deoxy-D-xylulose-5-phosphate reductoisomerase [Clostridiisalibacter paucivorans]
MKKIAILGSTGSIGTQTLDVVRNDNGYKVVALSANKNIDLLEKQAIEFRPEVVTVVDKSMANILKKRLKQYNIEVLSGIEGLNNIASESTADMVLTAVVGMVGLKPTLSAIKAKKTIALANKETLVTAGKIVMDEAEQNAVDIIPVDSEHSAIFQCLKGGSKEEIKRLILTASGGPFRGKDEKYLKKVNVKDALNHPNWSMGKKITIDSATLMNKGLEVIEARWLFDVKLDKIDVTVHPQSIVHSMVEYIDGSVIAQMGVSDMRIPIQYALTYPKRKKNSLDSLDFVSIGNLNFERPDTKTFRCLSLAMEALKIGGTMPSVLNASNEVVVQWFLDGKIGFMEIPKFIEDIMEKHNNILDPTIEDILESDRWARELLRSKQL